jgi:hypothetical protein
MLLQLRQLLQLLQLYALTRARQINYGCGKASLASVSRLPVSLCFPGCARWNQCRGMRGLCPETLSHATALVMVHYASCLAKVS